MMKLDPQTPELWKKSDLDLKFLAGSLFPKDDLFPTSRASGGTSVQAC